MQRRAHRPPRRSARGIALIEALVSILIFSFGVLGLIGLEASAINFSMDAEDRNHASLLASEIASSMWLAGNVNTAIANQAAWQTAAANTTTYALNNPTVTIVAVPGLVNTAGVNNAADITISWKPPSRAATSSNSTLTTRVILP
jgi:type IV pilus assembly protein PilV